MKNESTQHEVKSDQWFSTEIYFGRHFSNRGDITDQQFADFLSSHVTPEFPAGLTVYDAYGQMQHSSGEIVKQKTKVVVLVHKNSKADDDAINKIIAAYRSKFANPQVMLLTKKVNPVFYAD
jgi:hypothetical protein